MDARLQLFDLKTVYTFQTVPNVDQYNMPLYSVQTEPGNQTVGMYPVYQGITGTTKINGINAPYYTQRSEFLNVWPNFVQPINPIGYGNGTNGPYTLTFPIVPNIQNPVNQQASGLLRGHVDIIGIMATGVNVDPPVGSTLNLNIPVTSAVPAIYFTSTDATGANVVVADSGQFLEGNVNYGLLMQVGNPPFGNAALPDGYSTTSNTINYSTGIATVTFPVAIPDGQMINAQAYYFNPGLPRSMMFYNNIITLRNVPDTQYRVEADAYLSPAAFLNTGAAIPFGYMAEYIARGAARKMLSDTGDVEQFNFYEPLFREQEMLVWKRSQRQFTSTRTQTIYGAGQSGQSQTGNTGSLGLT